MASGSKRKTTMAKLNRERRLRERRPAVPNIVVQPFDLAQHRQPAAGEQLHVGPGFNRHTIDQRRKGGG